MKRIVVIACVVCLASASASWGKQSEAANVAGGILDLFCEIVTAPCCLVASCLGVDGPACWEPAKDLSHCIPVKKVARVNTKEVPTEKPLAPRPTVVPDTARSVPAPDAPMPVPESKRPVPTVRIEKIAPQDKPPLQTPAVSEIQAPAASQPRPATAVASPEKPSPTPSERDFVEKLPAITGTPTMPPPPQPSAAMDSPAPKSEVPEQPKQVEKPKPPKVEAPKGAKTDKLKADKPKADKPRKSRHWAPCVPYYYPVAPCRPWGFCR